MSYDFDSRVYHPPLPSDVTLRAPIYRRRGVIASLIGDSLAAFSARRQLARITRQYRAQPPQDLPDYLRSDIGLPPAPPRYQLPAAWEVLARFK